LQLHLQVLTRIIMNEIQFLLSKIEISLVTFSESDRYLRRKSKDNLNFRPEHNSEEVKLVVSRLIDLYASKPR